MDSSKTDISKNIVPPFKQANKNGENRASNHSGDGFESSYIYYETMISPIGRILLALSQKGLSAAYFCSSNAELLRKLECDFPKKNLIQNLHALDPWLQIAKNYFCGRPVPLFLPFDIHGTNFQNRVWEELQTIPSGQTRTYQEIAQALGKPKAARAVGHACARNPLPLFIPCHRVVLKTGNQEGYRWGAHRKKILLALEKIANTEKQSLYSPLSITRQRD